MLRSRFVVTLIALAVAPSAGVALAAPTITVEKLAASPATSAVAATLSLSAEGRPWLTWLETDAGHTSFRVATWDAAARRWNASQLIARGQGWVTNAMDTPAVTVGADGHATAVWLTQVSPPPSPDRSTASTNNLGSHAPSATPASPNHHDGSAHADATGGHGPVAPNSSAADAGSHHAAPDLPTVAHVSHTTDGGRTWSAPALLTSASHAVEFVALTTLADGRVLAAWLDGRGRSHDGRTQLRARIVGGNEPDALVDASVCDCCSLALAAFPDGTALLAYRARRDGEIRDILTARFDQNRWTPSGAAPADAWRIAGCPVNGPQLANDGGRVATTWFTAEGNDPRVLLSYSGDAGSRFLNPLRLSQDKAAGRVGVTLLHDGAILATWVDANGRLWLRRVSPDFVLGDALALTAAGEGRVRGVPRLALLRDYSGGSTAAEALVVFNQEGVAGLTTLRITIPETELLEAERNCDCAPTADQLQGFPIRGTLVAVTAPDRVRMDHPAVPGLFAAGAHEFHIEPGRVDAANVGRPFLARIERRERAWWVFNVRFIVTAPR